MDFSERLLFHLDAAEDALAAGEMDRATVHAQLANALAAVANVKNPAMRRASRAAHQQVQPETRSERRKERIKDRRP